MLARHLSPPLALIAVIVALIAGCGGSDDGSTSTGAQGFQITGSWAGVLHQQGLQPFRVTAEIGDLNDAKANTVHYTGINCDGNWTYIGTTSGTYRFREVINRGAGGSCKGVGIVLLRPEGADRLAYGFTGGGVRSTGTLVRTD
jgi:hypothetical protein